MSFSLSPVFELALGLVFTLLFGVGYGSGLQDTSSCDYGTVADCSDGEKGYICDNGVLCIHCGIFLNYDCNSCDCEFGSGYFWLILAGCVLGIGIPICCCAYFCRCCKCCGRK